MYRQLFANDDAIEGPIKFRHTIDKKIYKLMTKELRKRCQFKRMIADLSYRYNKKLTIHDVRLIV